LRERFGAGKRKDSVTLRSAFGTGKGKSTWLVDIGVFNLTGVPVITKEEFGGETSGSSHRNDQEKGPHSEETKSKRR